MLKQYGKIEFSVPLKLLTLVFQDELYVESNLVQYITLQSVGRNIFALLYEGKNVTQISCKFSNIATTKLSSP
jgi:hypothetical protein